MGDFCSKHIFRQEIQREKNNNICKKKEEERKKEKKYEFCFEKINF